MLICCHDKHRAKVEDRKEKRRYEENGKRETGPKYENLQSAQGAGSLTALLKVVECFLLLIPVAC